MHMIAFVISCLIHFIEVIICNTQCLFVRQPDPNHSYYSSGTSCFSRATVLLCGMTVLLCCANVIFLVFSLKCPCRLEIPLIPTVN